MCSFNCLQRRTFRVQQLCEAQVLFSQVKGILQIIVGIGFLQLVKVYQVRPKGEREGGGGEEKQVRGMYPLI